MPKLKTINFGAFGSTGVTAVPNADYVTQVEDSAFSNCSALTTAVLPSLIKLGASVFSGCKVLARIDFGPNLVDASTSLAGVRKQAFQNCSALTTAIFRSTTMLKLENVNAFTGTPIASGTGYIYVPSALVDSYKAATNWSTYANQIRAIEDYPDICGGE